MLTIIFGLTRVGKTCLMTHLSNQIMYDRERNKLMSYEIMQKNLNGFKLTIPTHCVHANYDIFGKKFGYSPRKSFRINPYRLGYKNNKVTTHFTLPYGVYVITEAQKYFNSRMSRFYPDWQSRWYEQSGHNYLDILMDVQRPNLIDVNIRELSQFIEVLKLEKKYKDNKIIKLTWHIRRFDNSQVLDKYFSSGKQDTSCYAEELITADYDVFKCYNSRMCKPKFYEAHIEEDFEFNEAKEVEESLQGFIQHLEEFDDELPKGFYDKAV